jgi:hypothetical protein
MSKLMIVMDRINKIYMIFLVSCHYIKRKFNLSYNLTNFKYLFYLVNLVNPVY